MSICISKTTMASHVTSHVMGEDQTDQPPTTTKGIVVVEEESIHNSVSVSGFTAVYQPCSVPLNSKSCCGENGKVVAATSPNNNCSEEPACTSSNVSKPLTSSDQAAAHGRFSLLSLRNVILGSSLFSCCRGKGDAPNRLNNELSGIELENLCTNNPTTNENEEGQIGNCNIAIRDKDALVENTKDKHELKPSPPPQIIPIPGAGYIETSSKKDGETWVVDCQSFCQDAASEFLKGSGDFRIKVNALLITKQPFQPIIKLLDEPILAKNVTTLKLENCCPTIEEISLIIVKLTELQHLEILQGNSLHEQDNSEPLMMEEYKNSCEDRKYFEKISERFKSSMGTHPQKLKILELKYPLIWQCNLVSKVIDSLMEWIELEKLNIQASPYDMLQFLQRNLISIENESSWEGFVKLDCSKLCVKSRDSLKQLSISFSDIFPLEHLRISHAQSQLHEMSKEVIFRWCYFCTVGIIDFLSSSDEDDDSSTCLLFPNLENCELHLPFVPVPNLRENNLRRPLKIIMDFLAKNNHIRQAILTGLRPEEGMENWIKNSLITIPCTGLQIGATYCSTTLKDHLPIYDDELVCLAFVIVPEETRLLVSEIIEPHGKGTTYGTWKFEKVNSLHIINELSTLTSYDMKCITSMFTGLTRLAIEDVTVYSSEALGRQSLKDSDIQKIFKYLSSLEYLHLDCKMTKVTDHGLTGLSEFYLDRLTQLLLDNRLSLKKLENLKYLFVRGFGPKVTDKSARFAFAEASCLKMLQELHIFAPGITNFGKDKIRKAFAEKKDFMLKL